MTSILDTGIASDRVMKSVLGILPLTIISPVQSILLYSQFFALLMERFSNSPVICFRIFHNVIS